MQQQNSVFVNDILDSFNNHQDVVWCGEQKLMLSSSFRSKLILTFLLNYPLILNAPREVITIAQGTLNATSS
jgi:hypothetical protein